MNQPNDTEISAQLASVRLAWNRTFAQDSNARFTDVQKFIDSECIRLMVPYTPMRNGILSKTAVLGTKIGSGKIVFNAPYARYQYYGRLMVSGITGSPYARSGESKVLTDRELNYDKTRHAKAQKLWFEVMKADKKEQILRGAAAIARRNGH